MCGSEVLMNEEGKTFMSGLKREERGSAYKGWLRGVCLRLNSGGGIWGEEAGECNTHHPLCLPQDTLRQPPKKKEPCRIAGGNVNPCSHHGEQYGNSLNN